MNCSILQQRTHGFTVRTPVLAAQLSCNGLRLGGRNLQSAVPTRRIHRANHPSVVVAGYYGSDQPSGKKASSGTSSTPNGGTSVVPAEPMLTESNAVALRRIAAFSFWSQLTLSITSAVILFFAVTSSMAPGGAPNVSVYFTLIGVVTSVISTFLSSGFQRVARRVLLKGDDVPVRGLASSLLRNVGLNLWGLGATIVGLQATVGQLVAKTLTTSTANPYVTNPGLRSGAPAALDAFSIQASTNTVLAHFVSIVFANWLLRILNKSIDKHRAAAAGAA